MAGCRGRTPAARPITKKVLCWIVVSLGKSYQNIVRSRCSEGDCLMSDFLILWCWSTLHVVDMFSGSGLSIHLVYLLFYLVWSFFIVFFPFKIKIK